MKKSIITLVLLFIFVFISLAQQNQFNVFGSEEKIPFSLVGDVYYLTRKTYKLPEYFDRSRSVGRVYTNKLDISPRDFTEGFPGITDRFEWFAIDYNGNFCIKDSGVYFFAIESDDGSKLFIDNELLINNDFCHEPTRIVKGIFLDKGIHSMEVQYFQGPRTAIALNLKYKYSTGMFKTFDFEEFKPVTILPQKTNDTIITGEKGLTIQINSSLLFDFNKFDIKNDAKLILDEIYHSYIESDTTLGIVIEGHTDSIGSDDYNFNLSYKRAKGVCDYLCSAFSVCNIAKPIGLGRSKPKCNNNSEESRSLNRRVELHIISKTEAIQYYEKSTGRKQ